MPASINDKGALFLNFGTFSKPVWAEAAAGNCSLSADQKLAILDLGIAIEKGTVVIPDGEGRVPWVYRDGRVEWIKMRTEGHTQ